MTLDRDAWGIRTAEWPLLRLEAILPLPGGPEVLDQKFDESLDCVAGLAVGVLSVTGGVGDRTLHNRRCRLRNSVFTEVHDQVEAGQVEGRNVFRRLLRRDGDPFFRPSLRAFAGKCAW